MKKIYTFLFITAIVFSQTFAGNGPGNNSASATGTEEAAATGSVATGESRASFFTDDEPTISIYPNPVKSFATITYTFDNVDKVSILNIVGKEMRTITFDPGIKETKVNLVDLQPGVYFLVAYYQGQTLITKKFLKEE